MASAASDEETQPDERALLAANAELKAENASLQAQLAAAIAANALAPAPAPAPAAPAPAPGHATAIAQRAAAGQALAAAATALARNPRTTDDVFIAAMLHAAGAPELRLDEAGLQRLESALREYAPAARADIEQAQPRNIAGLARVVALAVADRLGELSDAEKAAFKKRMRTAAGAEMDDEDEGDGSGKKKPKKAKKPAARRGKCASCGKRGATKENGQPRAHKVPDTDDACPGANMAAIVDK